MQVPYCSSATRGGPIRRKSRANRQDSDNGAKAVPIPSLSRKSLRWPGEAALPGFRSAPSRNDHRPSVQQSVHAYLGVHSATLVVRLAGRLQRSKPQQVSASSGRTRNKQSERSQTYIRFARPGLVVAGRSAKSRLRRQACYAAFSRYSTKVLEQACMPSSVISSYPCVFSVGIARQPARGEEPEPSTALASDAKPGINAG